jgi:protein-disulfide isomerase
MTKITDKKISPWSELADNPWIISLVLACVGISLFLLINIISNWPKLLAEEAINGPTTTYLVKEDFQKQANNDGNLTTKTTISPNSLIGPIISPDDPSKGNDQAPIIIAYFADFACNFCQQQELVFNQALQKYPSQIRLIRKDLPENDATSQSYLAAKAGRCAFQQNRFWPYHDEILANGSNKPADLDRAAIKTGLDINLFRQCLNNNSLADAMINKNWQEADALGISGTPYIYVNTHDFLGEVTWDELQTIIESIINSD